MQHTKLGASWVNILCTKCIRDHSGDLRFSTTLYLILEATRPKFAWALVGGGVGGRGVYAHMVIFTISMISVQEQLKVNSVRLQFSAALERKKKHTRSGQEAQFGPQAFYCIQSLTIMCARSF